MASFHSAHAYCAFDRVIRRTEAWLDSRSARLLDFQPSDVRRRMAQRLVEVLLYPGIKAWADAANPEEPPFATGSITAEGVSLDVVTGVVRITATAVLRSLAGFLAHWLHALAWLTIGLAQGARSQQGSATLLLGAGPDAIWANGSDDRFARFCRKGPVAPLARASRMIVQARGGRTKQDGISYARFPLLELLKSASVSRASRFRALLAHLWLLPSLLRDLVRMPAVAVIARECAQRALVSHLDQSGLIESVVMTNSLYASQPLWMTSLPGRRFRTHMVWYSQNTVPVVYSADGVRSDFPNYRHMRLDEHWVWTDGYARYLRTLGMVAAIHVVGPLLWYLPEDGPRLERRSAVAVFDVTPVKDEVALRIGLVNNYYSTTNMIAFLEQTVSACERVASMLGHPFPVLLKHKRSYGEAHDLRYIRVVESLVAAGRVQLVPAQTSLYSLIGASAVVVVVPYSSPAYIASHLRVPAVYLDPTGSLEATYEEAPLVQFVAGGAALAAQLMRLMDPSSSSARNRCGVAGES